MKKLFIIFLLFPLFLSAQDNKFKVGFSLNSYVLILTDNDNKVVYNGTLPLPPFHVTINLKYIINKNFSLHPKIGYALGVYSDYNGFEYGISGEYNFHSKYYASVGFMKHYNDNQGEYAVEADINFINAGFGYIVSRYLSIEIIYFYPLNKEFISNGNINYPGLQPNTGYIRRLESVIYLSFVFGWEL